MMTKPQSHAHLLEASVRVIRAKNKQQPNSRAMQLAPHTQPGLSLRVRAIMMLPRARSLISPQVRFDRLKSPAFMTANVRMQSIRLKHAMHLQRRLEALCTSREP